MMCDGIGSTPEASRCGAQNHSSGPENRVSGMSPRASISVRTSVPKPRIKHKKRHCDNLSAPKSDWLTDHPPRENSLSAAQRVTSDANQVGKVLGQSRPKGTKVPVGSSVDITIGEKAP
jgi:hypothetical protein